MSTVFRSVIAAALLAGSSFAATVPAQAHDRTGVAIAAGILGLGVGAAIASDHHYPRSGYYDEAPAYGYAPAYYAPAPVAYYDDGGGYNYGYGGGYYDGGRGYRGYDDQGDRHYRGDDRHGRDYDRGRDHDDRGRYDRR
jgi:hypothetical protein